MRQNLTLRTVADYLDNQPYIGSSRFEKSPYGKDLFFSINGQNLGRINIGGNPPKTPIVVEIPLYTSYSTFQEDLVLLRQFASRYGVKVNDCPNGSNGVRVYATKIIESVEDINGIYSFGIGVKNNRVLSRDTEDLSRGLESLALG